MAYFRDDLSKEPRLRLTKTLLSDARIPVDFWSCELNKIPKHLPYLKELTNYVTNLPTLDKQGKGLYLYGKYGTGKTGAAVAIVKEAMRRGARAMFVASLELETIFSRTSDAQLKEDLLNTHFLILDDLGAEKVIKWSTIWVETVIKLRNNWRLPTIITSNDSPMDFYGRIKSIASIMGGKYEAIEINGIDWRLDPPTT